MKIITGVLGVLTALTTFLTGSGFFSDYQTLQFFVFTVRLNLLDNA